MFDEENAIHSDDSNYVFTTEGHILSLEKKHIKATPPAVRELRRGENLQCPAYEPPFFGSEDLPVLTVGIGSRSDMDYARQLVGGRLSDSDALSWHESGWCQLPQAELFVSDMGSTDAAPTLTNILLSHTNFSCLQMADLSPRTLAQVRRRSLLFLTDTLSTMSLASELGLLLGWMERATTLSNVNP